MPKFAISGGHHPNTAGKRSPDGYREAQFNHPTANLVIKYLNEYIGVSTLKVFDEGYDMPLAERTSKANNWGADLYVSIHFNAAGPGGWYDAAEGIETLVYSFSTAAANGYNPAKKVHAELIAATKRKDRKVKARPDLWELRVTEMGALLCECGFMTHREERTLMASPAYQQQCARAIVDGLAAHYGLKKKQNSTPAPAPTPVSGNLFRVQIGAFGSLLNAQKFLATVKAAGFKDAFIKSSNGLNRIQAGAFSKYENAVSLVNRLKAAGFKDAWITQ